MQPKNSQYLGPLDGTRRTSRKLGEAPPSLHSDVRQVIKSYVGASRKPDLLVRTKELAARVQRTVPSMEKQRFFAQDPVLEDEEGAAKEDIQPGTFVEIRRCVPLMVTELESR